MGILFRWEGIIVIIIMAIIIIIIIIIVVVVVIIVIIYLWYFIYTHNMYICILHVTLWYVSRTLRLWRSG